MDSHINKILKKSLYGTINESLVYRMAMNEISATDAKDKFYKDIDLEDYNAIIKADPTYNKEKDIFGKYTKWLLKLYKQKKLRIEDLYKFTDYLTAFDKFKQKLEKKDINQYKDGVDLYYAVSHLLDGGDDDDDLLSNRELERKIKSEESEKLYEDDEWVVINPKTERASCYYGKGTQWCTAADRSNNMFDYYHDKGNLYININKKTGDKYQFHFENQEFMGANDNPIDIYEFFQKNDNLAEFYMDEREGTYDNKYYDEGITIQEHDGKYGFKVSDWSSFSHKFKGDISEDFIENVLSGMGSEYFFMEDGSYLYEYHIDDINEENQADIEKITGKSFEESVEDDFSETDEEDLVKDIIQRAMTSAQEIANKADAYNKLTDAIIDHYNIDKDGIEWKDDSLFLPFIGNSKLKAFIFLLASGNDYEYEDDIDYNSPYYGYDGDFDVSYFNELLSDQLYEEFDILKDKEPA